MSYPQHAKLNRIALGLSLSCLLMLGACGGGGTENQSGNMTLAASASEVVVGASASPITLTATGQAGTVSWTLTGPGSLSATTGSSVQYTPPATVAADESVTISASVNGGSPAQLVIKLHPSAIALLAGNIGGLGDLDGQAAAARFMQPEAVAVDAAGNIYIGDDVSHTLRKISAAGVVSTLAGTSGQWGDTDGTGPAARFSYFSQLAADADGNVYLADKEVIRKITPQGVVSTLAGKLGEKGDADGTGAEARFASPTGLAVDAAGNVYVSDSDKYTIRKITRGGVVSTLAGQSGVKGSNDGTGPAARFESPASLALDKQGNLFVEDRDTIRKISAAGAVSTVANAIGSGGQLLPPKLAIDADGNFYLTDYERNVIRRISPAGAISIFAGADQAGSADGALAVARFNRPRGLASDATGNLYVADSVNGLLRKISPQGQVSTVAGLAGIRGSVDGNGATASFNEQHGLTSDTAGNLYVADTANSVIRKISPTGTVTTVAGQAGQTGTADGQGTAARFNRPNDLAIDAAGNLYIADTDNYTIRKITPSGMVSTFAGQAGQHEVLDGKGSAAGFDKPYGIGIDPAGNLYVADTDFIKIDSHFSATIRKITPDAVVSTVAGTRWEKGSADGIGSQARFMEPRGMVSDAAGNIYIADSHNATIRKLSPSGVVSTLAGQARGIGGGIVGSSDGTGTQAQFNKPTGLTIDAAGNLYVADSGNNLIRKVTQAGVVTTVAGNKKRGTVLGALPGSLDNPTNIRFLGGQRFAVTSGNAILTLTLP
ncbi:DUF839 domain-containing protein [Chitinimonas arctica]|uniref:DUF839 domain-containing protein n=1 Tax=Chitinimonas arctica TaxID=2594795 RepID=A0A516SFI1_9NEIS|nr:NHL repeat-containing protein [Chitinimonas arctica]QDQ26927.1 DUF839 domain-containing protein [Chitinimonas arctica]